MVQVLRGDETIGQNLGLIATALQKIWQPDWDLQQGVKQMLLQKPEMIQVFSDLEAGAPGTLDSLGLGLLAPAIKKTPRSIGSEFAEKNRSQILKGQETKLAAETAKDTFTRDDVMGYASFLKDNPNVTIDQYMKRATGQTTTERDVEQKTAPAKIAQAGQIEKGIANLPDLSKVDFREEAKLFLRGKLPADRVQSFLVTPGASQGFNEAINTLQQEAQIAAVRANVAARGSGADNYQTTKAFQLYEHSKNAGSIDAWKLYSFGGAKVKDMVNELSKKPRESLTTEEKDLVDVMQAEREIRVIERIQNSRTVQGVIAKGISDVRAGVKAGSNDAELGVMLKGVNEVLAAQAEITGQLYEAHYGKIPNSGPFIYNTGIYYTDVNGKLVDEFKVLNPDSPTTGKDAITANAGRALLALSSDPKIREAELADIKRRDPAVYDAVMLQLGKGAKKK